MKIIIVFLAAVAVMTIHSPTWSAINKANELRLGSVTLDTPLVMHKRFQPLTHYLSKKLGLPVSLKLSRDMLSTINNVVHGDVELAYLTPVAYVRAHKEGDARLLVKLTSDNQAYFQLVIVVRNDSLINTIEDLQGKRFAFGDKEAMLQRAVVVGAGMPLEKFGAIAFLGRPYNIVRAVLHNDFDAGIVLETKAHVWENKGLRVLYTSPKLPSFNITVSSHVDDNMYQKLQEALLSLNANQSDDGKVFEALDARYNGFAVTDDKEYNVVRQLIAPFK